MTLNLKDKEEIGGSSEEPWKPVLASLWRAATTGRASVATALALVIFVFPAAYGILTFYISTVASVATFFTTKTTSISTEEENLRNEWVAVISYWPSEAAAREQMKVFKERYEKYETDYRHGRDASYPLWRDDIVVARDPRVSGRWILAIDTFWGPSSYPVVSSELARIARLGGNDPEAQNTYQRQFVGSKALCYSQIDFERTYGKIDPPPKEKLDISERPYVPCADAEN